MGDATIVFGRVPGQNIVALRERLHEFVAYLERAVDREIRTRVPATYERVLEEMLDGSLDVVVVGPELWLQAIDAGAEYEAVARPVRAGSRSYRAQFVCRDDAEIHGVEDVRGRSLAMVNKQSVAGYIAPLATLRANRIELEQVGYRRFLGSHENVLRAVLEERFDVGVTFEGAERTLSRAGVDLATGLRVFARTDPIPNEPLAFSRRFQQAEPGVATRLRETLLTMHRDPDGAAALRVMKEGVQRYEAITDPREYDSVRRLLFPGRPRISMLPGASMIRLTVPIDLDDD